MKNILILFFLLIACTQSSKSETTADEIIAINQTINIPKTELVRSLTWKGYYELWILTEERHSNVYHFRKVKNISDYQANIIINN